MDKLLQIKELLGEREEIVVRADVEKGWYIHCWKEANYESHTISKNYYNAYTLDLCSALEYIIGILEGRNK